MFPSLKDFNFANRSVLVRCDFNVPIKNGKVLDDFKILQALETLNYLKKSGAKTILLSHLGEPEESQETKTSELTLKPVAIKLEEVLKEKVKFSNECIGKNVELAVRKLKSGDILLLENLRLQKGEEENDEQFAKALARLGEVYVGEAFSVSHRHHASVVLLPKLLPHFAGFYFEREIRALSEISQNPKRPLVVVIGGVKIASKIGVIEKFLKIADHLLLGGKIANIILRVKGICVGKPWPEDKVVEKIKNIELTSTKIHLPLDTLASPDREGEIYIREIGPGSLRKEEEIFDVGKETVYSFGEIIKSAGTIFWSGPLGLVENEKFSKGTEGVMRAIVRNYEAFKVVGGGDTIAFVRKFNLLDKFSYVSTGGGAMLHFLAGKELPGVEALK